MAQQLSYNNNPPPAIAGLVAGQEATVIWSKLAQVVGGLLPGVGLLCSPGTDGLTPPAALNLGPNGGSSGEIIPYPSGHTNDPVLDLYALGIPVFDSALMQSSQITSVTDGTFSYSAYAANMSVPFLRKGRIWVYADAATTQFTAAYVYTTHETNQPLGSFGAAAGAGKSAWSRAQWLMTTAGAGLSLIEVW